jgi:DNA polymerase-3 subunit chi
MTEVLFYHLERQPLERVLPMLLEKSLERSWQAVVQAGTEERVEALDALLWTYRDDGFLPHGTSADGNSDLQPVFLTDDAANPNAAQVRFFVDGSGADDVASYERAVYLFDGNDPAAVQAARGEWARLKDAGHEVTYWQQTERGKWEKKA